LQAQIDQAFTLFQQAALFSDARHELVNSQSKWLLVAVTLVLPQYKSMKPGSFQSVPQVLNGKQRNQYNREE
jgi:hypothetical protein